MQQTNIRFEGERSTCLIIRLRTGLHKFELITDFTDFLKLLQHLYRNRARSHAICMTIHSLDEDTVLRHTFNLLLNDDTKTGRSMHSATHWWHNETMNMIYIAKLIAKYPAH